MRFLICLALLLLPGFSAAGAQGVRFGVVTKFEQGLMSTAAIHLIRDAGVSVNRDAVNWRKVEIVRGRLVWNAANAAVFAALKDQGISTDVILTTRNDLYDSGSFPTSPEAVAAFARFAGFVATQLRGQAVAFEIGNEFRPSPKARFAEYVALFVAAANAIHAADPAAQVVADPAIFANMPATVLLPVGKPLGDAARRALRIADGVVVHQYPYQRSGMSFAQAQAMMVQSMTKRAVWLEKLAGRPVPLYVTEYGWPESAARGLTAQAQAQQLAATTRLLAALPFVRLAVVYELADGCKNPANVECAFGLYARDPTGFVAKPALQAFRGAVAGASR